jgi:hypothetical protein
MNFYKHKACVIIFAQNLRESLRRWSISGVIFVAGKAATYDLNKLHHKEAMLKIAITQIKFV